MKSNREYRQSAKELTQDKIFNILIVLVVFSFVTGVVSTLSSSFGPTYDFMQFPPVELSPGNPGLVQLFNLILVVLSAYVSYSLLVMFIGITQNKQPELESLLLVGVKEQPIKAPLVSIVSSIFVALWSLLFVIPGVIKAYAYSLTTYILIQNKDANTMDILRESENRMKGKKMQLFLLDLSYFGWYFLSLFTLGILLIWVVPRHQTARTLFIIDAYADQ